ncbi:L,D-transpeptidase family protein [Aggregicoccus sp. 17bor-14]|nr:L,D-transpeptidase [Simulacricoccus sp. 17bor-14]MRI86768.1 L,D-transpeptidase family protein [Aggregicoccus sp. 17bor-14]
MALPLGCGAPTPDAPSAAAPAPDAAVAMLPAAPRAPMAPARPAPVVRREPTLAMDPALEEESSAESHVSMEQEAPLTDGELAASGLSSAVGAEGEEEPAEVSEPAPGQPAEALAQDGGAAPELLAEAPAPDGGTAPEALPLETIELEPNSRSLRARRSIAIRAEPREDAAPIGTLAQDVRVSWVQAVKGPGCDAWVQIAPRGWICERYLEGNFREPRARELPRLAPGAFTPGLYARVVGKGARAYPSLAAARLHQKGRKLQGSLTVRLQVERRVGKHRIWRTSDGEYIEARFLRRYRPSQFAGLDRTQLDVALMPLAWAQSHAHPRAPVTVRKAAADDAPKARALPPRSIVSVLQTSADGRWALVADGRWVLREDLHVVQPSPPPAEAGPTERWLDVDLQEQVLVAYEGAQPVYATLISSGASGHETPEGLYRIWIKFGEVDMKGQAAGQGPYRVATVPWVMFFEGDFALHSSYWHDRFGEPVSHGCVNLSPRDARALYAWSAPEVPAGWSMAYASAEQAGSLVRIHRGAASEAPTPLISSAASAP